MVMTKTHIALILILLSFRASAQEALSEESMKLCQDNSTQGLCASTCAPACSSTDFIDNNFDFCNSTGMLGGESSAQPDDPSCAAKFTATPPLVADPEPVPSSSGELDDTGENEVGTPPQSTSPINSECDALESQYAKRKCQLAKVTPSCAPTVTALEGQSGLLVTQIEMELLSYGELLGRDWKDVKNRSLLCGFSEVDLEKSYDLASQNPDTLRALQRQASDVQACLKEWDGWVSGNTGKKVNTGLFVQLLADAGEKLGPLKIKIEALSSSITKLQNASQTISEIIDMHIIFCDSKANATSLPSK